MNKIDRAEGALEQLPQWAILWRWANEGKFSSSREGGTARAALERCWDKLGNKKILFHRIHGDFTPFHALLAGNKLVVADWEESEPVGLPLYDAIHFIMARDIHLKRSKLSIENLLNKYKIEVFKELTASGLIGLAPVPDELFELALICAYTFLTHPQLRYAAWNE